MLSLAFLLRWPSGKCRPAIAILAPAKARRCMTDETSSPGMIVGKKLAGEVFAFLDRQFAEQYPPERRCDDMSRGCWRPDRHSEQDRFAFSADGIFDGAVFSRRVTGINFSDPVHARLSMVNDGFYNW